MAWLASIASPFRLDLDSLHIASADASFRRYFRVGTLQATSYIIMDAPPDKEPCTPFVAVADLLHAAGLLAPVVHTWNQAQGFMLLSDLGSQTMMQHVQAAQRIRPNLASSTPKMPIYFEGTADDLQLFSRAIDALISLQLASRPGVLPAYDAPLLARELALFPDWYCKAHAQLDFSDDLRCLVDTLFQKLIKNNLAWPSVFVHRDFMPRNLMLPHDCAEPRLGILDFQDAVYGPVTYDIASLMRDAFWSWDEGFVIDVTVRYWERARAAGLPVGHDFGIFYQAVEWMGLQRHLKVAGIFARLALRDGKPSYLADAPRFLLYLRSTAQRYRELQPLLRILDKLERGGAQDQTVWTFGRH
jgi:aminoglycoside/choline kinase family phosphotransferase